MAFLIGSDIGTTGTKTVLFNEKGESVAEALIEYPLYQPRNGYAEQNPTDWWDAAAGGIRQVISASGVNSDDIMSVGLSGQMHGLVMLDSDNSVIRPAIIWCDQRTAAEAAFIEEKIGRDKLIGITANPALAGFTAAKLLWVMRNEPRSYDKCRHVLLPKDYVRLMLTGEYATEVSDASGMQLLDVPKRCWSEEIMNSLGFDSSLFAKVYESQEITGRITSEAARLTGLKAGTPVVGGAGDQAAGAVGNGIVRSGAVSATIGTSGVVFAHTDELSVDPLGRVHTLCHAVPNTWHVMGVTQAAGLSFKWFRDNFFATEKEISGDDINRLLDSKAESVPAGANRLIYLPYLMGERTPHLDSDARGVFFGLSAMHTREDMLRAVLEGVVFSLFDCLNIIRGMGIPTDTVFASGGGGSSRLWRQIMADVFGTKVKVNNSRNSGALGAAILAGTGVGVFDSVESACADIIASTSETEVDNSNTEVYKRTYELYCRLYNSLKNDYKALSKI